MNLENLSGESTWSVEHVVLWNGCWDKKARLITLMNWHQIHYNEIITVLNPSFLGSTYWECGICQGTVRLTCDWRAKPLRNPEQRAWERMWHPASLPTNSRINSLLLPLGVNVQTVIPPQWLPPCGGSNYSLTAQVSRTHRCLSSGINQFVSNLGKSFPETKQCPPRHWRLVPLVAAAWIQKEEKANVNSSSGWWIGIFFPFLPVL